ncbi:MAG: PKD domain-containing protein, partial [Phaeodactylibacter sp.]|nr:PKD domain-containing protein [Phaeodactylibacter sp.]
MKKQSTLKIAFLSCALLCSSYLLQSQTYFYLNSIAVSPQDPQAGEDVCLEISGLKSTPCVFYEYFEVYLLPDNEIIVDMCWNDTSICIQVLDPWSTTECLGALAPGTYTVYFDGCNHNAFDESLTFEVTPSANLPFANFEPGFAVGCVPGTVQFENLSLNADTYLWDFGDGATSTEENPEHTYTDQGDYFVSLTATNSSTGDSHFYEIPEPYKMLSTPDPDLGPDLTMTTGDTLYLDVDQWSTYAWQGPGLINTANQWQYVIIGAFVTPGTYTVSVTVSYETGCEGSDELTLTVIEDPNRVDEVQQGQLSVFPNPSNERIFVQAPTADTHFERATLMNVQGQVIR